MIHGKYYPPVFAQKEFHCPYCNVYSEQTFGDTKAILYGHNFHLDDLQVSKCNHCNALTYWHKTIMIIPDASLAPLPHEDLPEEISQDYLEARSIVSKSPRGAVALLRLCLQKLTKELGEPGKDINNDIKSLVQKGLPVEVQKALDILRVVGNESVHPGTLDIKDDHKTAISMFDLINFIVEDQISRKKKIGTLFDMLPEEKKAGIAIRDAR